MTEPLLHLALRVEQDIFLVRQRGREVAAAVGLEHQDQVRIATALSEVARELLHGADGADVTFALDRDAVGRRILPKAETEAEARACLELLHGRRHRVHTAVALIAPGAAPRRRLSTSTVAFKRLHPDEIDAYVACGEWRGKAGGYAIQGRGAALITGIRGDYLNVVGLPLARLLKLHPDLHPATPISRGSAKGVR